MANNTKTNDGQAHAPGVVVAEPRVRVQITARCTAVGCVIAPGARITLTKNKADMLVALGKAKIIGV